MPWSDLALLAAIGAGMAVVSAVGTHLALAYALRRGMVDEPGERRSHAAATPRGGGVGIVVACLVMLLAIAASDAHPWSWVLVATGLVLVAGIGWWDDHRPLQVWPRLLVHAIAAALLGWACWLQGASPLAALAGSALALGLVNAWNFMDGIDGLAASQALLCGLGLALVLSGPWAALGVAVAGACLGFLPSNLPRAKVFLGDVGSGALGYLIAVLLAAGFAQRPITDWTVLLLAPMAMLVDTGFTLCWRMRRGERWWHAHVQHLFQRRSRRHGHARVTIAYALWTLGAIGLMLVLTGQPATLALFTSIAAFITGGLVWRYLHGAGESATEGFGS